MTGVQTCALPIYETVRGELRLCEGQIDRINGVSHHNAAVLNEAVQKFEEAQQALPGAVSMMPQASGD